MEQEKELTSRESLELITRMINKAKKDYLDTGMSALLWGSIISFCSLVAFAIFLLSYFTNRYHLPHEASLCLLIYGIPTFATGYARRFRPMIIGGLACWIFAIMSEFSPFPFTIIIYTAAGALIAWFIPGLILRKCYLKAKRQHV